MLNKDRRSMILSLVLGDGCLHYIKNHGRIFGGITITHGNAQADYNKWKAELLSMIFNRDVKQRVHNGGGVTQVSVCAKKLRAWRKFCYPNNKKDLAKVLRFITNPEFALAIWLCDDGYVEPSFTNGTLYSASLRIFTCDQTPATQQFVINWLKEHFGVDAKVRFQKCNKRNKDYPFIKINAKDSLIIWEKLRSFPLQFKSMQHKFRYLEQRYQYKLAQRDTSNKA